MNTVEFYCSYIMQTSSNLSEIPVAPFVVALPSRALKLRQKRPRAQMLQRDLGLLIKEAPST